MRHADNKKQKMTHGQRNRTTKSRKKNGTLGEKETHKYLAILKAETIKQVEMKRKN